MRRRLVSYKGGKLRFHDAYDILYTATLSCFHRILGTVLRYCLETMCRPIIECPGSIENSQERSDLLSDLVIIQADHLTLPLLLDLRCPGAVSDRSSSARGDGVGCLEGSERD
jgi:hypothetical protein